MNISKTCRLLGIGVGSGSLDELLEQSIDNIRQRLAALTFVCVNPHSVIVAMNDKNFVHALNQADLAVADGVGVALAGRLLNMNVGPRITGAGFFTSLLTRMNSKGGGRVFFFGSSDHVLSLIRQRFETEYPGLKLCGVLSPPFGDWSEAENDRMVDVINAARADVLWVGMTAPKQEKWVEDNRERLDVPVIGSIGAVFDFYAGTYPRAPEFMVNLGLEWLYRLVREPRRLWRRNLVSTPLFVWRVLLHHVLKRPLPA